jgi:hypothetical protein
VEAAAAAAATDAQHEQELQKLGEELASTQAQLLQLRTELGSAQQTCSDLSASKASLEATVADLQACLETSERSSRVSLDACKRKPLLPVAVPRSGLVFLRLWCNCACVARCSQHCNTRQQRLCCRCCLSMISKLMHLISVCSLPDLFRCQNGC